MFGSLSFLACNTESLSRITKWWHCPSVQPHLPEYTHLFQKLCSGLAHYSFFWLIVSSFNVNTDTLDSSHNVLSPLLTCEDVSLHLAVHCCNWSGLQIVFMDARRKRDESHSLISSQTLPLKYLTC